MNDLLQGALAYARRGWRIVPLWPLRREGEKWVCTCRAGEKCGGNGKSAGKHPRIKTGRDHAAGSVDEAEITRWWSRWPTAGIGIITGVGSKLLVVDLDGKLGFAFIRSLVAKHGPLPPTAIAQSGRASGMGAHLYFRVDGPCGRMGSRDGFDIRADGGLIVAPPSRHYSGEFYKWLEWREPALAPEWLLRELGNNGELAKGLAPARRLARMQVEGAPIAPRSPKGKGLAARALGGMRRLEAADGDLLAAAQVVGNADLPWEAWNRLGMACWSASGGGAVGLEAFETISKRSRKYDSESVLERWNHYATSPPAEVGFGALVWAARQVDATWDPPSRGRAVTQTESEVMQHPTPTHANRFGNGKNLHETTPPQPCVAAGASDMIGLCTQPLGDAVAPYANGKDHAAPFVPPVAPPKSLLAQLNERHAIVGDLGGKCLVMSWVRSKVDEQIEIPSFQSTKHFSDRYANQLISVKSLNKAGGWEEKHHPLGAYWLKWDKRKTYEGIDLVPNAAKVLPGNVLNLWDGFACQPRPGNWGRMRDHIERVLCTGNPESALYVLRWASWTVQHPGEQAEVALVFRGGKGSGKSTFGAAMRRIFGQHGLHIFSAKHLTGNFNAHLRGCCLLFADEAFWAGDKQGEGALKGLITERVLMIEQKGIDATMWRNMLHVIMAANAEWVIPASHDERRYAVFDVAPVEIGNAAYFRELHAELASGGLEAMLYAMLNVDLGGWHPREGCVTAALQEQKMRSLDSRWEWLEEILQRGLLPHHGQTADFAMANALMESFRDHSRRAQDVSAGALGRFLREAGALRVHKRNGWGWQFPALDAMRKNWEGRFGRWSWEQDLAEWRLRDHGLQ